MVVLHGVDLGQDVDRGDVKEGTGGDQHEDSDPELEHGEVCSLALTGQKPEENYHVHNG